MIFNGPSILALAASISTAQAVIPDCVWSCHQAPELRTNTTCVDIWDDVCTFASPSFGPQFNKCITETCPPDFVKQNPHFVTKLLEAFGRLNQVVDLNRRDVSEGDDDVFPTAAPPCAVYSLTNIAAIAGTSCPLNQTFGACVCQVHAAEKEVLEFCATHIEDDPALREVLKWARGICSDYTEVQDNPKDLQGETVEGLTIGNPEDVTDKEAAKAAEAVKDRLQKEAKKEKDKAKEKAKQLGKASKGQRVEKL